MDEKKLAKICNLIRYDILTSTTAAGSGHPTSSLSAVELMTTLFFGGFLNYDLKNPLYIFNDRVIFSKGHAAPLLYALYHAAGVITFDELLKLRTFDSNLEGHPSPRFSYIDVATGSLGQGLSVGLGMALGMRLKAKERPNVFVLLGDSEMAEGQIWEALEIASYYKLNNLVGILDVNRLGQRGKTMLEWDLGTYEKRIASFGWNTVVVDDGHDIEKISKAYEKVLHPDDMDSRPKMIIAKTIKGKGVSFLEDKEGLHGKAVPKDTLDEALKELGNVDLNIRGEISKPVIGDGDSSQRTPDGMETSDRIYHVGDLVATREAYGDALVELGKLNPDLVVFDGEVSNSTYAEKFKKVFPERFFEMYIAEQNMISVALGLSKLGFKVYSSSFAAFLTRAFDQLRMAQYSHPDIKICGSHAGVSIGEDGPSQMALEDLSMVRGLLESVVLYPSDGVSAKKLTKLMIEHKGISYLRTTRQKTPVIYNEGEEFVIGGAKVLKQTENDKAVVIAAGITLHEGLKAYQRLQQEGINITLVDLYSIKPLDEKTLLQLAKKTKNFIIAEDHYPYGGIGEAVKSVLANEDIIIYHLAVKKIPRSGKPEELLHYEEIDAEAIIKAVKSI